MVPTTRAATTTNSSARLGRTLLRNHQQGLLRPLRRGEERESERQYVSDLYDSAVFSLILFLVLLRYLNGYKRSIHDGGHRAAFIVRWPGVTAPGTVTHQNVRWPKKKTHKNLLLRHLIDWNSIIYFRANVFLVVLFLCHSKGIHLFSCHLPTFFFFLSFVRSFVRSFYLSFFPSFFLLLFFSNPFSFL